MSPGPEHEARRALARLRRAVEKARRELDSVAGTLRSVEAQDFPGETFEEVSSELDRVVTFVDEQEQRLAEKILHAGGLEPGRVRRTGGLA
jgi:hypothetical protein